ncbi:MAG: hypothetical protein ABR90_06865 [Cryomorphaceae bacterium BACL29 MAG-121220-bin8]|jgi:hypothetical protein|nr:MAG: hypothetical protein ABR90_06865 [Cryomorphaceae bacterium BACL29 MAG-121220-bin8]|tara:strand:+ start:28329 stop:28961 length:633 start_codon:yes stop_codon:yes gene_type:complete
MIDIFKDCELNRIEYWLVIRLYIAASIPVILSSYYLIIKKASLSVALTLISTFLIAAFGWELWLTYGLAGGLPVDQRRSAMLTCAIPVNLNWLLNSLADVLIVWIGLFLVKFIYRNKKSPFLKWNWGAFAIFLFWFIIQNIYVEAFFYNLQLGFNGDLSWAPLHPFGSWFNPTLFNIAGSPITLQAQTSWILMTPIVYLLSIYFDKKYSS